MNELRVESGAHGISEMVEEGKAVKWGRERETVPELAIVFGFGFSH